MIVTKTVILRGKHIGPKRCINTIPGLTHSLDSTKEGLMPNSTQFVGPAANPMIARLPKQRIIIPSRVAERAAIRYVENDKGCHISTYSTGSHGYAQIGWRDTGGNQVTTAHRAAWVYAHGTQIPEGMTIDHVCKERRCVDPNHLRLLTNYENARRTAGRDWPIGECVNGHPNSLIIKINGRFHCGECAKGWKKTRPTTTHHPLVSTGKQPKGQKNEPQEGFSAANQIRDDLRGLPRAI